MISVILTATDDARALARLLTALVPGAAEGLVREVAVLGASDASLAVADDAGVDLYEAGDFAEALTRARGPWLAGLPLDADLAPDWVEQVATHLRDEAKPARITTGGFWPGPRGWLVEKRAVSAAAAREQDLQRLAGLSGRRLRILRRR